MTLSTPTIETLTDLLENKLTCFEVWDREDKRELKALQSAREELRQARAQSARAESAQSGSARPPRPRAVPMPDSHRLAVG